jgi:hypothetical protein
MARRPAIRQCKRCGKCHDGKVAECDRCGTALIRKRWRMDKGRLARVHMLAKQKGLIVDGDREFYELRLGQLGITSAKGMTQAQYLQFCRDVGKLPDVN